ncbi:acyl-CoA thioester hydrolase YbgC [Salmonella enterica subsp. enterica serovar Daytona]|uniref:Acyl-CoA thioester hydrolase YbgC n=1 Tax=Salmonella enterica subsp. enterica serovar Daytona TaxID=1962639 RepID=A0A447JKT2_SALET|nr:acyl-CoA thioester hydrolase YbgC [Salmonella enterica subsp. enterica serovar Daytona]
MVKMSVADWRRAVNPGGKYMPGKPAWYMFDNCQSKHAATNRCDVFCRVLVAE